jgi:hypothetical protein
MTHLHQRETEKVKTEPLFRYGGTFIISSEPDTPDPILRRRLDEHPVAGTEQELAQVTMLAEFGQIAGDDQLNTPLRPDLLAESAHLPGPVPSLLPDVVPGVHARPFQHLRTAGPLLPS